MAGAASKWVESEMDEVKIEALVAAEKIPQKELVNWVEASGQHWPSGEIGQIPVFQAYCECGLRLPAHPFLTQVYEHTQHREGIGNEVHQFHPKVLEYECEERVSRQSKATLAVRQEDGNLANLP